MEIKNGIMKRSIGITILAWLDILTAAGFFCAGLILIKDVPLIVNILFIIIGTIFMVVGIGLLQLKRWARIICLVLAWIGIADVVWSLITKLPKIYIRIPLFEIITIWFFNKESVKEQFISKKCPISQ